MACILETGIYRCKGYCHVSEIIDLYSCFLPRQEGVLVKDMINDIQKDQTSLIQTLSLRTISC